MTRGGPGLARPLLILALAGLLGACSAPQSRELVDARPPDLAPAATLADVPFVASTETLCGPTSLAMLLRHRARVGDPDRLREEVYLPGRRGALQLEMTAALRARGLLAYPLRPHLADLLREVQAGNPVLVLQNLGLDWYPRWHYAVVFGYDLDRQIVRLRSGELADRRTGLRAFEQTWARAGHWAIVASTPENPPATADWLPWLQLADGLRATGASGPWQKAMRTATRYWPDQPVVLMTAAGAALAGADTRRAENLLRRTVDLDPRRAEAWNNLAHVLNLAGCRVAARVAAECAVRLDPNRPLFAATLAEIGAAGATAECRPLRCPD